MSGVANLISVTAACQTQAKHLPKGSDMLSAVQDGLMGLTDFKGRATRPQFWYFYLFIFLLQIVTTLVFSESINSLLNILFFFATLAVSVRRMHDVGKSGWFILVPIYNLVLCCTKTKEQQ
jgi:uncharacterized membrane protein YhaH (DUF805 family)